MGWKTLKKEFDIKHIVCVTEQGICIGSPYIHNIIVLGMDGTLKERERSTANEDLCRYQRDFQANPEKVLRAIQAADTFSRSIPVWTFSQWCIVEKQCEQLGWPNVTHDGEIMYENTFFSTRAQAVAAAIESTKGTIEWSTERVAQLRRDLRAAEVHLQTAKDCYAALIAMQDSEEA